MADFHNPRQRRHTAWARLLVCLVALPLTIGWAPPPSAAIEIAAAADSKPRAPASAAPERITDAMLAGWPKLLSEDWSQGLKIVGRDPDGRWSRTMSNGVKWHEHHGEKHVLTFPGQNGQTFDPFSIVRHDDKHWLRITARVTPPGELKAAWNQPIQSGVLTNFRTFGYTYGYVEARVILPDVHGAWPAFWTLPNDNKWPPEIDVFEFLHPASGREGGVRKVFVNTHWRSNAPKGRSSKGGYVDLPNGGKVTDPHVYGVLWTKDFVAHYIDRRRVMVVPNPADEAGVAEGLHKPMHLIFSLAMGGQWPGPVDMKKLPASMEVTDIGVWGLPNKPQ